MSDHYGKQYGDPQNIRHGSTAQPASPLPAAHPEKMRSGPEGMSALPRSLQHRSQQPVCPLWVNG